MCLDFEKLLPQQEINFWQSKFRVLKDWKIKYLAVSEKEHYVDECLIREDLKRAYIYPRSKNNKNPDYFLHEMLHIMFCAVKNNMIEQNIYHAGETRESEEQSVHDLCGLILKEEQQ